MRAAERPVTSTDKRVYTMSTQKTITYYTVPYQGDQSLNTFAAPGKAEVLKGAFSFAILVVSGYLTVTKAGRITPVKGGGDSHVMGKLSKACLRKARMSWLGKDGGIDAEGLASLQARLNDAGPAFNTDSGIVAQFVGMIRKGGQVEIEGLTAQPIKPYKVTVQKRGK